MEYSVLVGSIIFVVLLIAIIILMYYGYKKWFGNKDDDKKVGGDSHLQWYPQNITSASDHNGGDYPRYKIMAQPNGSTTPPNSDAIRGDIIKQAQRYI